MTTKSIIETSLGRVRVTHFDSGDAAIWWPACARVGEPVVELIDGRAKWNPASRTGSFRVFMPSRYSLTSATFKFSGLQ